MFSHETCEIKSFLHEQSPDINQGVDRINKEDQGAGDQGIMFGYACDETENYIPLALDLSHKILFELAELRRESKEIKYLRPDSKSQVTLQYDENGDPEKIISIVISTQHDDFDLEEKMLDKIKNDIKYILIPRVLNKYPGLNIYLMIKLNITSIPLVNLSLVVLMEIQGLLKKNYS